MARSEGQKLKLMYLAQIFREFSDENHTLSVDDLIVKLAEHGISAERKAVYLDIGLLCDFGMTIEKVRGKHTTYYLSGRDFEATELKILADAVACSRFITKRKSTSLIKKIGSLSSIYESRQLSRQVIVSNRIKTMNESIYYNVDTIQRAIDSEMKISFQYFDYDIKKRKKYHSDGALYTLSPYALAWEDENYYCIGFNEKYGTISNFRVDKMEKISVTETPQVKKPESFDLASYTSSVFSMFTGEAIRITLRFDNSLSGVVLDRFGKDILLVPDGENHFTISPLVCVSPILYGWIFQFGKKVEVLAPENIRLEMKQKAMEMAEFYK